MNVMMFHTESLSYYEMFYYDGDTKQNLRKYWL
jgi:hypothetical protein